MRCQLPFGTEFASLVMRVCRAQELKRSAGEELQAAEAELDAEAKEDDDLR